jgi:hypothetical protein
MARYRPRKRFKHCYELTLEFLIREDDRFIGWRIVHGMVDIDAMADVAAASGVSIDHAWLESDDQVYDTTLDQIFAKDDYYRRYSACSLAIYTAAEAARLVLDYVAFHREVDVPIRLKMAENPVYQGTSAMSKGQEYGQA